MNSLLLLIFLDHNLEIPHNEYWVKPLKRELSLQRSSFPLKFTRFVFLSGYCTTTWGNKNIFEDYNLKGVPGVKGCDLVASRRAATRHVASDPHARGWGGLWCGGGRYRPWWKSIREDSPQSLAQYKPFWRTSNLFSSFSCRRSLIIINFIRISC